jgi:hypothetical protein
MTNTVNTVAITEGPTMSNRRPDLPHNQLFPRSLASSGSELDECCGDIKQSEAGLGLDEAIKFIDGGKK